MTISTSDIATTQMHSGRPNSIPRPEYPRPDRDRSPHWVNLNGLWELAADGQLYDITVPFAWESEASGVNRHWLEHGIYSRSVAAPTDWEGARIVLCFGAVHHHAIVRIDGDVVGEHRGGYDSFEYDVTPHLTPGTEAELTVEVYAPADKRQFPHGKQRSIPRDDYDGVAFTPTSGIWQTVWLEARGGTYARSVVLRGDSLTGIDVTVDLGGDDPAGAVVDVSILESHETLRLVADGGRATGRIELEAPRPWSPESPHLYEVEVVVSNGDGRRPDRLVATVGLRRFEVNGEQLFLNESRFYVRGVLDQGYWPDTGLTAPSLHDLQADIDLARDLGYNLIRKHLKFEEPLWLHEADRTGMLVWAEPACTSRFSPASIQAFEAQLPAMVERDGNHPSIVIWSLYNEEWGLDWDIAGSPARTEAAARAYDVLRGLDATRPIVENSGWSHVKSDLVDWHYYEPDLAEWRRAVAQLAAGERESFPVRLGHDFVVDKSLYSSEQFARRGVPIINSEYGEGFTSLERAWHLRWETQELRRHDRFAGYVYTELADIEHEAAGLLTTDRRTKDWGGCIPSDVNADTILVIDLVPAQAGADIEPPQERCVFDLRVSHHGPEPIVGRIHATWIAPGAPVHQRPEQSDSVSNEVQAQPFELSNPVSIEAPARPDPGRLLLWLETSAGETLARSFLDAAQVEPPNRRGARPGELVARTPASRAEVRP